MSLWTPGRVDRKTLDQRERYSASMEQMMDRFKSVLDRFNPELKRLDPDMEMVFFPHTVDLPGVRPGRYHVVKRVPWGPPSLIPIVGPRGEFVEPDSGLFTWLAKNDMWNARSRRERERLEADAESARLRQSERETEDRQQEILERWRAVKRTQVSMNTDTAWGQNAKGARAARANRKRKP